MLAHLSRFRIYGGSLAKPLWQETSLRFAGDNAHGNEISEPSCFVIDVGRDFTMSFDGKLYLTGAGKAQFQTFTPTGLLQAARKGWFGFTLLYDEQEEPSEFAEATDECD